MRGTTLVKLLDILRVECGLSLNPAHNPQNRDTQIATLQRVQETMWADFAWPHLRVERTIDVQAGQRYYDMPGDLDIDRIEKIEIREAGAYLPLGWGIEAQHYAESDSELGERSWPVRRVRISEDEQLEVWPVPDSNFNAATLDGRIKITGIRKLKPLVADDDRADLDDQLLVLYAAAEMLARSGSKDAQVKQDKANRHYLKLRGNLMPRRTYKMFGVGEPAQPLRPVVIVHPVSGT